MLARRRRRARSRAWQASAAARTPDAARGGARRRRRCASCALAVPNRPGVDRRASRWRSGAPASTSRTWRSTPSPDSARGSDRAVGRRRASRPRAPTRCIAELGHGGTRQRAERADAALRARAGRCEGTLAPPPDKSISHRAALLGAMADAPVRIANYLDAADTRSTLARGRRRSARSSRADAARRGRRSAAPACARRASPTAAIDVGNAGTLMRLLPGWLAAQEGERSRSTATSRSAGGRSTGSPSRCALMGATIEATDGRFPPLTVAGAALHGHRLRAAGRQRAGEVVRAARRPAAPRARRRSSSRRRSRDHTERMLARVPLRARRIGTARARSPVTVSVERVERCRAALDAGPRRPLLGGLL